MVKPIVATRKTCSATDSLPEPRNWNPLLGVFFNMPSSKKKLTMCFNLSLPYPVIPSVYRSKIVQIVEAVEIAIQIAAESRSHRIISDL
jgi:hypothetical protein